jgi:hypothetical protein
VYVRTAISVAVSEVAAGSTGGVCVRRTFCAWERWTCLAVGLAVRVAAARLVRSGWLDSSAILSPAAAG